MHRGKQTVPSPRPAGSPSSDMWLRRLHAAVDAKELAAAIHLLLKQVVPAKSSGILFRPFEREGLLAFTYDPVSKSLYDEWLATEHQNDLWLKRAADAVNPTSQVVRHTDHTPYRIFRSSNFYKKWLRRYDIHYGAGILVWKKKQWLMLVSLLRSKAQGDWTEIEMIAMRAIYPQIALAVKRVARIEQLVLHLRSLEYQLSLTPTALFLVDWDLKPIFCNKSTRQALQVWHHGPVHSSRLKTTSQTRIPEELKAACGRLKREIHRKNSLATPYQLVQHEEWPEITAKIQIIRSKGAPLSRAFFLIDLVTTSPATPSLAPKISLAQLTDSEKHALRLVAAGKTNRQIGEALHKSPATIKNQIYAAFKKLGLKRRSELIARLNPAN